MDRELNPPEPKEHPQDCGCMECEQYYEPSLEPKIEDLLRIGDTRTGEVKAPPKALLDKIRAANKKRAMAIQKATEAKNPKRRSKKALLGDLSPRQARNLKKRIRYIEAGAIAAGVDAAPSVAHEIMATKKTKGRK